MSSAPRIGQRNVRSWLTIVVLSLLIHVAALDVLPQWTLDAANDNADGKPIRAILMARTENPVEHAEPPPPAAPSKAAEPAPAASHSARKKTPPRITEFVPESLDQTTPHVEVVTRPAATVSTQQPALPEAGGTSAADLVASPETAEKQTPPPIPTPQPMPQPMPMPQLETDAPASARLAYKVVAVERKYANPVFYYGVGSISWASNQAGYQIDLKAAIDFILIKADVLASHSEGAVTSAGLEPQRYTETPRKRSTVATNFNRDARQSISYSSSSAIAPLLPGAQDRLSVLFQIGALLRVNPNLATMGGHIDIPVAGVRGELETWVFDTQGIETIEVGIGPLMTAHLRRVPKPGSNDKTIDIWIAHLDGGYPARVLYTEPNGSTIEMTLEKIEALS